MSSKVLVASDFFDALAVRAEYIELVFVITLEVIIKRLSTDRTSHSLRSILSPKDDGLSGFVVPFVRNWKDQLFVLPCDLPRLEFARSNLKTREIPFMQTEEIRLYHFSECVSLIFGDVLINPIANERCCLFPV